MRKYTVNSQTAGSMGSSRRQNDFSLPACPCPVNQRGGYYDVSDTSRLRSDALSSRPRSEYLSKGKQTYASFESSYPKSCVVKDDELSRALAGANSENGETPVNEQDLFFIIEELNQQTCILKSRLAEMMAQHQKEKCSCNPNDMLPQDNSPKSCTCKERPENDRCRGGTGRSGRPPLMVPNSRECSFYRQCGPTGEIYEQKLYVTNMDDSYQKRSQAGGASVLQDDGRCRCNPRTGQGDPQNKGNNESMLQGSETASIFQEDARSRGGVSTYPEKDGDNKECVAVTKSFVEKMHKIQDDILGLKNDLKSLTQCKCACADYNQAQFRKRVNEIEKTLSTISTKEPSKYRKYNK